MAHKCTGIRSKARTRKRSYLPLRQNRTTNFMALVGPQNGRSSKQSESHHPVSILCVDADVPCAGLEGNDHIFCPGPARGVRSAATDPCIHLCPYRVPIFQYGHVAWLFPPGYYLVSQFPTRALRALRVTCMSHSCVFYNII